MLFQAAWQIGMALVTPHSNPCSASFSFTSFITSPGDTHKPLSPGCPHRFLSLLDIQVPSHPPINTLLMSQHKPAVNFKIPFSIPVKRWPWAVWLCTARAVLHGSCDTEFCSWREKVTANVTGDATLPPQGQPWELLHGYNTWELLTGDQWVFFNLSLKTLTFWLGIKEGW